MAQKIVKNLFKLLHKILNRALLEGQDAQNCLISLLESEQPCMIGRFGSCEIQATLWSILPPPPIVTY